MSEMKSNAESQDANPFPDPPCELEFCWAGQSAVFLEMFCVENKLPPGTPVPLATISGFCTCPCPPAACASVLCAKYSEQIKQQCSQDNRPAGFPLLIVDERLTTICVCVCA
jgi:hypothetical protein